MWEKIAVLTFDDAVSNHASFVMPLLKEYGFGATFYITEYPGENGDRFDLDKHQYMTWTQIAGLDREGFEVGNHTGRHIAMRGLPEEIMTAELELIEQRCLEHGIQAPRTFCYPCGIADERAVSFVRARGYRYARITGNRPYLPGKDDPLAVPSFVIREPLSGTEGIEAALAATEKANGVCVLTFHGVPDYNHPWVTVSPEGFSAGLDFLHRNGWRVKAMRDL